MAENGAGGDLKTTWERIDLPVLNFIQALPFDVRWQFDRRGPVEELPEFDGEELNDAVRRLEGHGLIHWGDRTETFGYFAYVRMRLAPDGLRALGEWPPRDNSQLVPAVVSVLADLAQNADDAGEDGKPLRRAAGAVGRFSGDVLFGIAKAELGRLGGDLGS